MEIIKKVLSAKKLADLLDLNNLKTEYREISKQIHPDLCKDPDASKAFAHLSELKDVFEKGITLVDEAGIFKTNGYYVEFQGNKDLLRQSYKNWTILMSLTGEANESLKKRLPKSAIIESSNPTILRFEFAQRAIPLTNLNFNHDHTNWIVSRLLEFTAYLRQAGYVHAGLNPESVFIVPETHGIIVTSFYHMTPARTKLDTIPGKYQNWYLPQTFNTKMASSDIDIELSKKIGIYLLGDASGIGIKLKKTHNKDIIDFLTTYSDNPMKTYERYRKILKNNFKSEFITLNI